ncbi:MAG: porphobilinogen synthase [Myxococcales bacterium]|nr:porphobilinogen synthase [Myxococcales bacterium]
MTHPIERPRRLRATPALRALVRETTVRPEQLVAPLFLTPGSDRKKPITSMPGHAQLSVDLAVAEARALAALGVRSFLLFGVPDHKDEEGSGAWDPAGPVATGIKALKDSLPDCIVMADVCVDEYTSHGHCGVLHTRRDGVIDVDNDATVERLARIATVYAAAGADVIAPSDMMDGRVGAIRWRLDAEGFSHAVILSYAVKYASAFYGPFREAADCAPKFGDRAAYQMDPANAREALRELRLDIAEGADMVMVKPALAYLDVIAKVRAATELPLAAYNVSGEYAMLHAAAQNGWIDLHRTVKEVLTSIVRAGADIVITYHARDVAEALGWR